MRPRRANATSSVQRYDKLNSSVTLCIAEAINFSPKFSIFRGNSPNSAKLQWLILASLSGQAIPQGHVTSEAVLRILQQCQDTNIPSNRASASAPLLRSHVTLKVSQLREAGCPSSTRRMSHEGSFLYRPCASVYK